MLLLLRADDDVDDGNDNCRVLYNLANENNEDEKMVNDTDNPGTTEDTKGVGYVDFVSLQHLTTTPEILTRHVINVTKSSHQVYAKPSPPPLKIAQSSFTWFQRSPVVGISIVFIAHYNSKTDRIILFLSFLRLYAYSL